MAILSDAEYVRVVDKFLSHWAQVNAVLGASPLVLKADYTIVNLKTDRDALEATLTALVSANNNQQMARAQRSAKQKLQSARLKQFRNAVLGKLDGTDIAAALPLIPSPSAPPETWIQVLEDMENLWERVNTAPPAGFTAPLVLPIGYTQANFTTDITGLKATYTALAGAENAAKSTRESRTKQAKALRARLIAYRKAAVGSLPTGHALLASLPGL
ncbi:hypothetical protein [Armatimonas sp.]|uniref:hypothetical protein n=1 Tax=Armatimonas sp. TaxID=1872638 RepID=UPI0037512BED